MKFCTFQTADGDVKAGWIHQNRWVVDMHTQSGGRLPKTMLDFLQDPDNGRRVADELEKELFVSTLPEGRLPSGIYPVDTVQMLSPLPRPASIRDFYAFEQHVKTARQNRGLTMVPEWYKFPVFYFSNHQAVLGPDAPVEIPPHCEWFDYELEIACVIGRKGKNIPASEASSYIFGFMIMNDWSARDLQREEMRVGLGPAKGKDFATSLGPWLVTPDELAEFLEPEVGGELADSTGSPLPDKSGLSGEHLESSHQARDGKRYNLGMRASVNGILLSEGNYRDIYFPFEAMIERASAGVTLYPGDVIGSGTVGTGCILELGSGVHRWLRDGDIVELTIDGLGTLRNVVKG